MGRILVISDIHGMYDEFIQLLKKVEYSSVSDKLVLLGDYTDRGFKSREVIELVRLLVEVNRAVAIRGNHDEMFLKWLEKGDEYSAFIFFNNGGLATIESYCGLNWFEKGETHETARDFILTHYPHHVEFLKSLPIYHETDEYIFVHAGIDPLQEDWKQTPKDEMIWIRDMFFRNKTNLDKVVVFGHTPCVHIHGTDDIYFGVDKIGVDGGCCYGLQLNCLVIEDGEYQMFSVNNNRRNN